MFLLRPRFVQAAFVGSKASSIRWRMCRDFDTWSDLPSRWAFFLNRLLLMSCENRDKIGTVLGIVGELSQGFSPRDIPSH